MTSATNRALCLGAVPFLFVPLALDASAQETARPRLPLRQAHQRKERRKTVATRRSLLAFCRRWARSVATIRWAHALGSELQVLELGRANRLVAASIEAKPRA